MTIGEVIELLKGIFEALVELFTAYFAKSEEGEGSTEEV